MLETLAAAIGTMMVPSIIINYNTTTDLLYSVLFDKLGVIFLITLITVVTNVVRAWRFCTEEEKDKDGKPTGKIVHKSYGISYGIKKGILCGSLCMVGEIILSLIPELKVPFEIIEFIPGLGSMVDGFVLAVFYLVSYVLVAYPIWGSC